MKKDSEIEWTSPKKRLMVLLKDIPPWKSKAILSLFEELDSELEHACEELFSQIAERVEGRNDSAV